MNRPLSNAVFATLAGALILSLVVVPLGIVYGTLITLTSTYAILLTVKHRQTVGAVLTGNVALVFAILSYRDAGVSTLSAPWVTITFFVLFGVLGYLDSRKEGTWSVSTPR